MWVNVFHTPIRAWPQWAFSCKPDSGGPLKHWRGLGDQTAIPIPKSRAPNAAQPFGVPAQPAKSGRGYHRGTPLNGTDYILTLDDGDHLGSTSLTTDSTGTKTSEMRYNPWGEVRYTWTTSLSTTPAYQLTRYTYTGQYSYMDDPTTAGVTEGFGLMFYQARWYDPGLGRFAQADTVVQGDNRKSNSTIAGVAETQYVPLTVQYSSEPAILNKLNADNAFLLSKGGLQNLSKKDRQKAKIVDVPLESQVLDRYAYSLNNPVRYNDPTGYDVFGGDKTFGFHQFDNGRIMLWVDGVTMHFDLNKVDNETLSLILWFRQNRMSIGNLVG